MIALRERNWRRELILLGLVGMEAIWLTAFYWILVRPEPYLSPISTGVVVLVLMLVATALSRALTHGQVAPRVHWAIMTASLLLAMVLVLYFLLLPIGQRQGVTRLNLEAALSLLLVLGIWWRGNTLAQLDIASPNIVIVHFWIGLSVFFLVTILGEALLGQLFGAPLEGVIITPTTGVVGFIPAYFFLSLLTLSLARIEEVTQMPESTASVPRLRFWIGFVPAVALLVVLLSLLLSLFFTGGGLTWTLGRFPPILQAIGKVLDFVVLILLTILEWLFRLLLPVLDWFVGVLPLQLLREAAQQILETIQQFEQLVSQMEETRASGDLWVSLGKYLPAVLFVLGIFLIGRAIRRRRRQEKKLVPEEQGHVASALGADREGNLLRQGMNRLADRFREGLRFFYALSIRRIYVDLGRLAAHKGYPRLVHQTPYEYQSLLGEAFPDHSDDVQLITRAYVSAHYGQVPDTRGELDRIRAAWQRIRASD